MAAPKKNTDIRICGVETILATFARLPKSIEVPRFQQEKQPRPRRYLQLYCPGEKVL